MGRGVNIALRPDHAWRVAALSMMGTDELHRVFSGDPSVAAAWVEAAAATGIAEAQVRLGRMLLEGEGVAKDPHGAFACFFCAAQIGDADAQNMLGRCYENGWGTPVDLIGASVCYRRAAHAGLAWAQYNLGHMLLDGIGVTRDREAAFIWYRRAADQGHARAMNLVARCHEEGWGVLRDPVAAQRLVSQVRRRRIFSRGLQLRFDSRRRRPRRRCCGLVRARFGDGTATYPRKHSSHTRPTGESAAARHRRAGVRRWGGRPHLWKCRHIFRPTIDLKWRFTILSRRYCR